MRMPYELTARPTRSAPRCVCDMAALRRSQPTRHTNVAGDRESPEDDVIGVSEHLANFNRKPDAGFACARCRTQLPSHCACATGMPTAVGAANESRRAIIRLMKTAHFTGNPAYSTSSYCRADMQPAGKARLAASGVRASWSYGDSKLSKCANELLGLQAKQSFSYPNSTS